MTSVKASDNEIILIGKVLNNTNEPLKKRFRALFTLRNLGGKQSIEEINSCFKDESELLKHECAYVLGQMQDELAIDYLIKILEDESQQPIVRHEAGEALGALGDDRVMPILEKYSTCSISEIAETCYLAIKRIRWLKESKEEVSENPYKSVDPAPPSAEKNIEKLTTTMLNEKEDLFERYRALFALRNIGTTEAVLSLSKGLFVGSPLFRHEIAYVLGQMQHEAAIPSLEESLRDPLENCMVRHESAEALGSIGLSKCNNVLKEFLQDKARVVKESCEVALDMSDYNSSGEFQYANALLST
ncbi:DgyrCDS6198 [Dimorphilus gyrociliatus]|uniref:Deoxyhypusine hydroxylase n=1 Tax=Dimorphilus gyrociliatus TaxID=2664684 RepID=A0A7I8VS65_9ANNE|nr:DgyrCDS6198 [Dimorphilus gyrociliatus]